ncbi:peptidoglycan-binding protein [Faecousia sp.]|uniref:peptidoglycan-binding protein n=1 Tax=Faecousia sp. TaxID=2952921 RepID=UPI003AB45F7C
MTVYIGSARIDERGKASGGKAGDQTGKEVSTQAWYRHAKGWVVLRPKDGAKAKKIAEAMQAACDNDNIGYDQYQNQTLWNQVKDKGYDPAKATEPCETDCARLVRVCCAYAGIMADDFYTATEADTLMRTGEFVKLTSTKYTTREDYLGAGDILVTKTKGHTAVVLSNGKDYDGGAEEPERKLGDRILRDGDYGADVIELQTRLKAVGYDPGEIDGEFGPNTESAVKALQTAAGILVDGEFGPDSLAALAALEGVEDDEPADAPEPEGPGARVAVSGGNAYIRTGPGTQYDAMGVAHAGDELTYANPDGWAPVLVGGRIGWISGKYAKVVSE